MIKLDFVEKLENKSTFVKKLQTWKKLILKQKTDQISV